MTTEYKAQVLLTLAHVASTLEAVTIGSDVQSAVLDVMRNVLKDGEPLSQDMAQVVSNEDEAGKPEEPAETNAQEPACGCDACNAQGPQLLVAKTHEGKAGVMSDAGVRKMLQAFAQAEVDHVREAARSVLSDYGYTIYARVA